MKTKRKSIDIPEKEYKKLSILALENGISFKKYIEEIILEALKEKENFKIVKVN
jgi:macrodomain Ter protein organizer (MatP/YcbG family)